MNAPFHPERLFVDREERTVTLLIVAKLRTSAREGLCRIRNVSAGGMLIETRMPLGQGETVTVEIRGQRELSGTIAWADGAKAGISFADDVSLDSLLVLSPAPASRILKARVPRGPRLQVDCKVEVQTSAGRVEGWLRDISQGGAKLSCPFRPQRNERLLLMVPGLPMKLGIVRWVEAEIGIVFAEPLSFDLLAEWMLVREGSNLWSGAPERN